MQLIAQLSAKGNKLLGWPIRGSKTASLYLKQTYSQKRLKVNKNLNDGISVTLSSNYYKNVVLVYNLRYNCPV